MSSSKPTDEVLNQDGTLFHILDALRETEQERDRYKSLCDHLKLEVEKLKRGLVGNTREKKPADANQLAFDVLGLALKHHEPEPEEEPKEVKAHKRKKPSGRKPLPEDLPKVRIDVLPEEVKQKGLEHFEKIGEEVSQVLEHRPASMVCVEVVRGKYVRKADKQALETQVHMAQPLELPIQKGRAGPGMLADTIIRRWGDHCPLNRLESIYKREGIDLARSTICNWHVSLAELLQGLIKAMLEDAFKQPYLCTDATGVLVQAKEQCQKAHFWVLVAPEKHVLYKVTSRHDNAAVDSVLKGYTGYLVADAATVYDHLYAQGEMKECSCWAHARRYFYKALEHDPERAKAALGMIARLFRIEKSIATAPRKKREKERKTKSKPIAEKFFAWVKAEKEFVAQGTPMQKAFTYASNQEEGLLRFLQDGRIPLTNNISERELRRQVVGRKNWMFLGSDQGAKANTTFVSLIASCKLMGVEPSAYLRDLLCIIQDWPARRVLELAPAYWNETRDQEEAQRLLAANPFRQIVLDRDIHRLQIYQKR